MFAKNLFPVHIISLIMSLVLIVSLIPQITVVASSAITIDQILQELEDGKAYETMISRDLSEYTDDEINNDVALMQLVSDLKADETINNGIQTYDFHTYTKTGTLYTDTITDASGNTLVYYFYPKLKVEYTEVPHSGTTNWYTKLYLYEYISLNGSIITDNAYINRISLKNIYGKIGVGSNASVYSSVQVGKYSISSISLNSLAVLAAILSTQNSTVSAILSSLSAISYSSGSTGYTLSAAGKNMIGAKFNSSIALNDSDQALDMTATICTTNSSASSNTSCGFAFVWTFDVYKGSSKYTSTSLSYTGTTYANYS